MSRQANERLVLDQFPFVRLFEAVRLREQFLETGARPDKVPALEINFREVELRRPQGRGRAPPPAKTPPPPWSYAFCLSRDDAAQIPAVGLIGPELVGPRQQT